MLAELFWVFLTGLAGSLHCLGMCGPIVIAYSMQLQGNENTVTSAAGGSWAAGLTHHALFHAGRIVSYGLLGGLAAGFVYMGNLGGTLPNMRITATMTGGILMVLFGLIALKIIPIRSLVSVSSTQKGTFLRRFIWKGLTSGRVSGKLLLGLSAGFLPCMLSWAMIVKAASTGNITTGFVIMVLFGLGTVPVLLFTGFFASIFSLRVRLAGERAAGLSIIIMGLIMIWKGVSKLV